jgi:hypothetical protein
MQAKALIKRPSAKEKNGAAKLEKRLAMVDGRTTHRPLPPKGTPPQTGTGKQPWCLKKEESATYILCDCEAIAYLRVRHMGHYFMEPRNYYDAPIRKVLHFMWNVGMN